MIKKDFFSRKLILVMLALGLCVSGAIYCAASPPAGIPAPVSELMSVGNPDGSGTTTITGAPGAVNGGADVSGSNTSQSGMLEKFKILFYSIAYAQVGPLSNTTTANSDGSFQMILRGDVGNNIQIFQTVDDEDSPSTDLFISGKVVNLGTEPRGIATDTVGEFAYITGGSQNMTGAATTLSNPGNIFALNFSNGNIVSSFPAPSFSFTNFSGITGIDLNVNASTPFGIVVSPDDNELIDFNLFTVGDNPEAVGSPLAVSIFQSGMDLAVVGVQSDTVSVGIYLTVSKIFDCFIALTGGAGLVATPLVKMGMDGSGFTQVIAVSQFADGSWVLSRNRFESCPSFFSTTQIVLPDGVNPAGLASFNSTDEALVTDANNNLLFVANFPSMSLTSISVGNNPQGVAVDESTQMAYVVNGGDNSLSQVDLRDLSLKTKTGVGLNPTEIGLLPDNNQAVVLSTFDQAAVVVDLDF